MIRVDLASGNVFWLDTDLDTAAKVFAKRTLVSVGSRYVNGTQVTQLTEDRLPSTEIPEKLED